MLKLRKILNILLCLAALAVVAIAVRNFLRPLPAGSIETKTVILPSTTPASLGWPSAQAALGTSDQGLLATHGDQKPVSIASVAKVITALSILKEKPLAPGEQGPTVTLDQTDVDYFNYYYTHDGSVAQVAVGEKISEFQMLEALMLPSANNMADSLVRWAFGSPESYSAYAQNVVKELGMNNTTVKGASGFADGTLSTAGDLVRLGQAVMKHPVLSSIVREETANIPVAGTIRNVNWLLGEDGVNGIKTGNTNLAGGCFLFSAEHKIQGQKVTLIGAVLGAPTLNQAIIDSRSIVRTSDTNFQVVEVARGTVVGTYSTVWGAKTDLVLEKNLSLLAWRASAPHLSTSFAKFTGVKAGASAGTATLSIGSQQTSSHIIAVSTVAKPSLNWRLTQF